MYVQYMFPGFFPIDKRVLLYPVCTLLWGRPGVHIHSPLVHVAILHQVHLQFKENKKKIYGGSEVVPLSFLVEVDFNWREASKKTRSFS